MNAAIYSRKSKFTGKGESVENQIELCREYIHAHFEAEHILIYEDEGFSGGNTDRPEFKRMIEDSKKGVFDVLVCYRLDRISRNIADFASLIEDLSRRKIAFVSIKELFDTSTPMGRAMMFIASVFAQLERETIAERIRDNMIELAKTGRWLGGTPPTGYRSECYSKITVDKKTKKIYKLVAVPEEQEIVKLIFSKYLELKSQTALEAYLLQNNIKTKNGRFFSRHALRSILENPVYAVADSDMFAYFSKNDIDLFAKEDDFDGASGMMAYNKTKQEKNKSNKQRDISEWIIAVGKHNGIISGKDWCMVQRLLLKNADKRYRKPQANQALLSGLVRCGGCGGVMRPKIHRKESGRFSYLCTTKEKSNGSLCSQKNVAGNELDEAVLAIVEKLLQKERKVSDTLSELAKTLADDENGSNSRLKRLQDRLCKNNQERQSLIDKLKYADKDVAGDIVLELKRLKLAAALIETEIAGIHKACHCAVIEQETADLAGLIYNNYFSVFETFDIVTKRDMLKKIISAVTINGEEVLVQFAQSG